MKRLFSCAVVALVAGWSLSLLSAADDAKPKYTIKEVMGFLKKDKLVDKFEKDTATKEEKEKLLEGYESMLKQKPPMGDEADWKKKCEALVKAVGSEAQVGALDVGHVSSAGDHDELGVLDGVGHFSSACERNRILCAMENEGGCLDLRERGAQVVLAEALPH